MASRTASFRLPDVLHARVRALRPYVAHAADIPRDLADVTNTDVLLRALVLGLDVMERHRQTAIAEGEFYEPSREPRGVEPRR